MKMSEVVNDVVEQQNDEVVQEEQAVDYKALYEETQKKLNTVAAHKDKLYQETKAAKAEREAAKAEALRIEQEKALKDGEFEKLWQTAKQEKEHLMNELNEIRNANKSEKINVAALKIASELADGDNVELLSEFVKRQVSSLADEHGNVAPDVMEAVANEFKQNQKFKALLRGSKAAGGGAPGGSRSAQEVKTISRSEFDSMSHSARAKFIQSGGRPID